VFYPNEYDGNRARGAVINLAQLDSVQMEVSAFLRPGDTYELHNAADYFGDILTGTYSGGPLSIPMTGHTVAKPFGYEGTFGSDTFPTFGAFVLIVTHRAVGGDYMAIANMPSDVFRFVTIRGADQKYLLDPAENNRAVVNVFHSFTVRDVDWRNPPDDIGPEASAASAMDAATLHQMAPWLDLAEVFSDNPTTDFRTSTVRTTTGELVLPQYASTREFQTAYSAIVNSWLVHWVRDRSGQQPDAALMKQHETAIRFARLILMMGDGTYRPADGSAVKNALLVLPKQWRHRKRLTSASPDGLPNRTTPHWKVAITAMVNDHKKLATKLRGIERILFAATHLNNKRGFLDGKPRPLDESFYTELKTRLNETDRQTLDEIITVPLPLPENPRPKYTEIEDFSEVIREESRVTADLGNDLCRRIHIFEREAPEKLPEAPPLTSQERPSIRALGWGDLYVVREQLLRYEAQEIAHIENVLQGEKKSREHERTHRIEQVLEFEATNETFSERDLETSERFMLQSEASQVVNTDFSIDAGVNTSGTYGLTTVSTSLDIDFSRSTEESQHTAMQTAQDVISKSVERTQKKVRELRRTTTIETIREQATHTMDNTASGGESEPQPISGVYLWVEKIHEAQLYHYGKRLMIEFHVPEPGLSLIQSQQSLQPSVPKPAPLRLGPNDITEANYLCLTELYGAQGVEPPPPALVKVGCAFQTEKEEGADHWAESTMAQRLKIPEGYMPSGGVYAITGAGRDTAKDAENPFHAHLAIGGIMVLESLKTITAANRAGASYYVNRFDLSSHAVTDDQGLPITVRLAGHFDSVSTTNVYVDCLRSDAVLVKWQLQTYEKLKQAHGVLVEEYKQAMEVARFQAETQSVLGSRPSEVNRSIERDELKKWAIKLMRVSPFTFDAVVEHEGVQEVSPPAADKQGPIVSFFEEAFEWNQMSYFLYPYFWGRRTSWDPRQHITVADDPQHEKFLKAGAARVIVPVTPGYEPQVIDYLERPEVPEEDRIDPVTTRMEHKTKEDFGGHKFETLWVELLQDRKDEVVRGRGTLKVTKGNEHVEVNPDGWMLSDRDVGREIYIEAERYAIVAVDHSESATGFALDRPYEGPTNNKAIFATGSVAIGAPWTVKIPTRLLILRQNTSSLNA
jgi:hypothetical protein